MKLVILFALFTMGSAAQYHYYARPETRIETAFQEYVRNLIKDRPESQEFSHPPRREEAFTNYQCIGYCPGCCPCCAANPQYDPNFDTSK